MNIIIESNNSRIRAAMTIFLETTTEIKKERKKRLHYVQRQEQLGKEKRKQLI